MQWRGEGVLVLQEGQHERAGGERSVSVWMAITVLSAKQEVDERNEVGAHVEHGEESAWVECGARALRNWQQSVPWVRQEHW